MMQPTQSLYLVKMKIPIDHCLYVVTKDVAVTITDVVVNADSGSSSDADDSGTAAPSY